MLFSCISVPDIAHTTAQDEPSWIQIVEDAKYAWNGLIRLRDQYSPEGMDLVVGYNSHTNEASETLGFGLLDASLWMYLITGNLAYLRQARLVADDIETYLLNDKDIVCMYNRHTGRLDFLATSNRGALAAVAKLAYYDDGYNVLVEKLADAMIRYEISPDTNLFYKTVFPNGSAAVKEMYMPYDGGCGLEALLMAYEVTLNHSYLSQAYDTIISYWEIRNKTTNLVPSWVYSDTRAVKEAYMQQYGAGIFLKLLLHYYYLTQNDYIYIIIEEYVEAVSTYMWDGLRWNYRTTYDGQVAGRLGTVMEANFPKLDDALFLVYDLNQSAFQDSYDKAKADYDSTFQNKLIITNNLVKHAVYDSREDFKNHQSCIGHAFPDIQNPAMRLHHDTGNESYLQSLQDYYNAITQYHKRSYGYIGAVDPYSLEDDPYSYGLNSRGCGYICNKITSILRPTSTVEVVWTTVGNEKLTEPLIVTYGDTGWFNEVEFNFTERELTLNRVTGKGTISLDYSIDMVIMDEQEYLNFTGNTLYTASGPHNYTIKLKPTPSSRMNPIIPSSMSIAVLVLDYVVYRNKHHKRIKTEKKKWRNWLESFLYIDPQHLIQLAS